MNKLNSIISFSALIVSIIVLVLFLNSKQKIAYVDIETVYNEFQMKKELEGKFQNVAQLRQNILDSLKLQLNVLSNKIKSEKDVENIQAYQLKRQEYLMKEENFFQSNTQTTQQYKDQIWKQMSQYITDFGKKNGYEYILGYDKSNSGVLYGNEIKNITDELKQFINQSYKGSAGTK